MSSKLTIRCALFAYSVSATILLAGDHTVQIIERPADMSVGRVAKLFAEHPDASEVVWAPLEQNTVRLGVAIPRLGFEQAVEYQDVNALFYLSDVRDFGLRDIPSDALALEFDFGSDGAGVEISHKLRNGLTVGVNAEYLGDLKFGGFIERSFNYGGDARLSARAGFTPEGSTYLGGDGVRLSFDESSETFGWFKLSPDDEYKALGFGRTWFEIQDALNASAAVRWDSGGWAGGFFLTKTEGDANLTLGLVDIDSDFSPALFAGFSIALEKSGRLEPRISLSSEGLRSQYLSSQSLKPFRREELSGQWRQAMDFKSNN